MGKPKTPYKVDTEPVPLDVYAEYARRLPAGEECEVSNPLIGKRVVAVYVADDGGAIKFEVEGAEPIVANADGDCCSHSWIENVENPENLLGTVSAVEDIDMPDLGTPAEFECLSYYGCKISTERGSALIDYRNESNGYYGGNLVWPGEYFYGGVYGQNLSNVLKDESAWKLIARSQP